MTYRLQSIIPSEASSSYMLNWLQNAWEEREPTTCYRLEMCPDSSNDEEEIDPEANREQSQMFVNEERGI